GVTQREDHAIAETVTSAGREAGLIQLGGREALAKRGAPDAIRRRRCEADPKRLGGFPADGSLGQVCAGRVGLGGVPQEAPVERRRRVQQLEQPVALGAAAVGLGRALLVLELDTVAVGQPLHRRREVERLGLGDEADRIAAHAAPEAVVDLLHRVDPERGGALLVEGAASAPLGAGALHLGAPGDEVDHVDGLLYGLAALVPDPRHRSAGSASYTRIQYRSVM